MCSCLGSGYGCGGLDREVRDMEKGVAEAGELIGWEGCVRQIDGTGA